MRVPRVCVVSALYHPSLGGLGRQAQLLTEGLARAGVELFVLSRRMVDTPPGQFARDVEVIRVPALFPRVHLLEDRTLRNLAVSLSFSLRLVCELVRRRHRYDLVHFHGASVPLIVSVPFLKVMGKPVLAKVAAANLGTEAGALAGRYRGLGSALAALLRPVDGWAAISDEIRAGLLRDGVRPERIHRLDNVVDTERFCPVPEARRDELRARLGLVGLEAVVFSGRLVARKGLETLLRAWPTVARARPRARLLVLGDGEARREYQELAQALGVAASVGFLGHLGDVTPYLQAADLFVLPSFQEGMPNALLEALACGVPTVATRIGGVVDIAAAQEWATLVGAGDTPALARALGEWLAEPARLRALGRKAAEAVAARFGLATRVTEYRDLYARMVAA